MTKGNPLSRLLFWFIAREKSPHNVPHHLRFPAEMATRSPPLPNLPKGPNHTLSNNSYFNRDYRRQRLNVTRFGNTEHTPLNPPEAKPSIE
eukprot:m.23861 g.23861  ORF g.23861 m.23861 type:complete len:91 (+) comp9036_c0_seq1:102-374(+)